MRVTASEIRGFIRDLAATATENSATFSDTLAAAARAARTGAAKGKVLTGTTSGGTSAMFTIAPPGDWTARDIVQVLSALEDRVEEIKAADNAISDADLVALLKEKFKSVRSFSPDFSGLRV